MLSMLGDLHFIS